MSIPYNPRAQRSAGANGGYGAPQVSSSPYQARSGQPAQPAGGFQSGSLYRSPYQNAGSAFPNYPRFEEQGGQAKRGAVPTAINPQFARPMSDAEDPRKIAQINQQKETFQREHPNRINSLSNPEAEAQYQQNSSEASAGLKAQKESEIAAGPGVAKQNQDVAWDQTLTPEERRNKIAGNTQVGLAAAATARGGDILTAQQKAASPYLTSAMASQPMTPGAPIQTPVNVPNTVPPSGGGILQSAGAPTMDSTGQAVKASMDDAAGVKKGSPTPPPVAATMPPMNQPAMPGRLPIPGMPTNPYNISKRKPQPGEPGYAPDLANTFVSK